MSECGNCGRGNGEHTDNCITGLRQQLSTLREAAQAVVDAHDAAGPTTEHGLHCACMGLLAELKEQDSPVASTGGADQP